MRDSAGETANRLQALRMMELLLQLLSAGDIGHHVNDAFLNARAITQQGAPYLASEQRSVLAPAVSLERGFAWRTGRVCDGKKRLGTERGGVGAEHRLGGWAGAPNASARGQQANKVGPILDGRREQFLRVGGGVEILLVVGRVFHGADLL